MSNGLTSATLNMLEPDIGNHSPREPLVTSLQQWVKDNDPREAVTSTGLQQDDFECPGASNMQAKVRHENPRSVEGLRQEQQTRTLLKEFR